MKNIEFTHGEPGSHVDGSTMYRGYCPGCGQAIRVRDPGLALNRSCEVCSGTKHQLMPGGYAGPLDEDSGGYGANARMALDGD